MELFNKLTGFGVLDQLLPPSVLNEFNKLEDSMERKIKMLIGIVDTKDMFKIRTLLFRIIRDNIAVKSLDLLIE